ncbi:alpha/beta hydrolase [Streptomyces flavidovirens]
MMGTTARCITAALVGLALAGAGVAACQQQPETLKAPEGTEALRPFHTQRVEWKTCGQGEPPSDLPPEQAKLNWILECTTVEVPLDYAQPGGERVALAVNRSKATNQARRIGSLLVNPGGPGGSGLQMVANMGATLGQGMLEGRYDVVGFDPRGVGESGAVQCLSGPDYDRFYQTDFTPDTNEERQALDEQLKRYAEACRRHSGKLLPHVGTENAARDMDVLRAVLGDAKLHYYGMSYGTELGQVYAEHFPRNIGRMVLDSVVDSAEWHTAAAEREQMASTDKQVNDFLAWCGSGGSCPLGNSMEDGRRALTNLFNRLERQPMQVPGAPTRPVTETVARDAIGDSMYSTQEWPALEAAFAAALRGDAAPLRQLVDEGRERDPKTGQYGSLDDSDAAIVCLAMPEPDRRTQLTDETLAELRKVAPVAGESMLFEDRCRHWPVPPTMLPHPITAKGAAAPILIVNNTRDPATPIEEARAVAGRIANSALLANDADGHGVFGKGPCVNNVTARYLLDGTLPDKGNSCSDNALPSHTPEPPLG